MGVKESESLYTRSKSVWGISKYFNPKFLLTYDDIDANSLSGLKILIKTSLSKSSNLEEYGY